MQNTVYASSSIRTRVGSHVMRLQLRHHLLCQSPHLVVQGAVAELQVMIRHQILDVFDRERHPHGDADGTDRQKLDDPLNPHRPARPDAFERRQPHHLRLVEEKLARTPLAGIHDKLGHRLPEQFTHRLPRHARTPRRRRKCKPPRRCNAATLAGGILGSVGLLCSFVAVHSHLEITPRQASCRNRTAKSSRAWESQFVPRFLRGPFAPIRRSYQIDFTPW